MRSVRCGDRNARSWWVTRGRLEPITTLPSRAEQAIRGEHGVDEQWLSSHTSVQWAARKPNLLNVAVSRAKRRLYVIGDWQAWAPHRHFNDLAHHLPHFPPVTQEDW
jgi:hypothetical protein